MYIFIFKLNKSYQTINFCESKKRNCFITQYRLNFPSFYKCLHTEFKKNVKETLS